MAKLDYDEAHAIIEADAELGLQFFKGLLAYISRRVLSMNASLVRSAEHDHMNSMLKEMTKAQESDEKRTPFQLAKAFDIPVWLLIATFETLTLTLSCRPSLTPTLHI